MLEKFKTNALSNEQMKNVKGGVNYICQCDHGGMYTCSGDNAAQIKCAQDNCNGSSVCYNLQQA